MSWEEKHKRVIQSHMIVQKYCCKYYYSLQLNNTNCTLHPFIIKFQSQIPSRPITLTSVCVDTFVNYLYHIPSMLLRSDTNGFILANKINTTKHFLYVIVLWSLFFLDFDIVFSFTTPCIRTQIRHFFGTSKNTLPLPYEAKEGNNSSSYIYWLISYKPFPFIFIFLGLFLLHGIVFVQCQQSPDAFVLRWQQNPTK